MKYLVLFIYALFCTISYAKDAPILTRFDESTVAYQALAIYTKELNLSQNEYNFVIRVVPGALGETADLRSLSMGKENEEHMLYSTLTSYTSNTEQFKNSWDREKSFIILKSFWSTTSVLSVEPEEKSYESFIEKIKNKNKIYYGSLIQGGNRDTLAIAFLSHYGLIDKTKLIRYSSNSDLNRAVLNKEVDFSINVSGTEGGSKPILSSGEFQQSGYMNGREIGIEDFYNETISILSVPSTLPLFAEKMKPIITKMCYNERLNEFAKKVSAVLTCRDSEEIKKQIKYENEWTKKYPFSKLN
jgi:hypothetical protein